MLTTTSMKTHGCGEITKNELGSEVTVAGWVSAVRDLGGIIFVELRDKTGLFQLVADPQINPDVHKVLSKIKPLQNESIVDFTKRMSKLFCE